MIEDLPKTARDENLDYWQSRLLLEVELPLRAVQLGWRYSEPACVEHVRQVLIWAGMRDEKDSPQDHA